MAISFAMGLSVELVPGILDKMPDIIKNIFSSGITTVAFSYSCQCLYPHQGVKLKQYRKPKNQ